MTLKSNSNPTNVSEEVQLSFSCQMLRETANFLNNFSENKTLYWKYKCSLIPTPYPKSKQENENSHRHAHTEKHLPDSASPLIFTIGTM